MLRLTWDTGSGTECRAARQAFDKYVQRGFIPKYKGASVQAFIESHGTLTFEPRPTAFDRIMKEDD